jgi:chitin disaccharide deacetylase
MNAPRRISLCADDFGASVAACEAIIELAGMGAISATSALVDGPAIRRHARVLRAALRGTQPGLSIGLHLDLTEFAPMEMRAGLREWLWRGFVLRNIDMACMRAEIRRQLLQFEDLFDRPPAFADGHCHVHQIPGVREALVAELCDHYGRAVAVRSTRPRSFRGFKSRLIATLGGNGLHALLDARRLHTNGDFAGAYDFTTRIDYATRMRGWLRRIADGGLIMCHPERHAGATLPGEARAAEHRFLCSREWPALLERSGAQLAPFNAT